MFIALLVRLLLCTPLAALLRSGRAPWAWPVGGVSDAGTFRAPSAVRHRASQPRHSRPLRRPRGREPPGADPPSHDHRHD